MNDNLQITKAEGEGKRNRSLMLSYILEEIYLHRLLNRELILKECLAPKGVEEAEGNELIDFLLAQEYLEEAWEEKAGTVLFLTENAISRLKREGRRKITISAEGLRLDPYLFSHQLSLNRFVYALERAMDGVFSYTYYDLRHLPVTEPNLWPDGVVELSDCFLFLEMDMGTEKSRDLRIKWNSYKAFLNNHPAYYDKPIVMAFILSGSAYCTARRHTVLKTAFPEVGEYLSDRFEIYAEGPDAMIPILLKRLAFCLKGEDQGERSMLLAQPDFYEIEKKSREEYLKPDEKTRGDYTLKAVIQKGMQKKEVALILDFWLDNRLSIPEKMNAYTIASAEDETDALPIYLIVVEDRNQVKRELNQVDCKMGMGIYFLTKKDLSRKDWQERLFQLKGPVGSRWLSGCNDFFQRVSAPL